MCTMPEYGIFPYTDMGPHHPAERGWCHLHWVNQAWGTICMGGGGHCGTEVGVPVTHTYIHAYIHTCIHTYMHTYIHTSGVISNSNSLHWGMGVGEGWIQKSKLLRMVWNIFWDPMKFSKFQLTYTFIFCDQVSRSAHRAGVTKKVRDQLKCQCFMVSQCLIVTIIEFSELNSTESIEFVEYYF